METIRIICLVFALFSLVLVFCDGEPAESLTMATTGTISV